MLEVLSLGEVFKETAKHYRGIREWILELDTYKNVPKVRGRRTIAKIKTRALHALIDAGQAVEIAAEDVLGTVNIFLRAEHHKHRLRVLKETELINEFISKLESPKTVLSTPMEADATALRQKYQAQCDFKAFFDQILLSLDVSRMMCFQCNQKWYRCTRLPMGQRQAVFVAQTIASIIAYVPGHNVDTNVYVDNIRVAGETREEVAAAMKEILERAIRASVTVNELGEKQEVTDEIVNGMVKTREEWLGRDYDFEEKTVKVGTKTIEKVKAMRGLKKWTWQNVAAIYGLLFYCNSVTKESLASKYSALRFHSRMMARDDIHWSQEAEIWTTARDQLAEWMDEVVENKPRDLRQAVRTVDYTMVTDASDWGWGAAVLNMHTGRVKVHRGRWPPGTTWSKRSTTAETETIYRAVCASVAPSANCKIMVHTDNMTTKMVLQKKRSPSLEVNAVAARLSRHFPGVVFDSEHIPGVDNFVDHVSRGKEIDMSLIHGGFAGLTGKHPSA